MDNLIEFRMLTKMLLHGLPDQKEVGRSMHILLNRIEKLEAELEACKK